MKILFEKEIRGRDALKDVVLDGSTVRSDENSVQKLNYSPFKLKRLERELGGKMAADLESRGYSPIPYEVPSANGQSRDYMVLNHFGFGLRAQVLGNDGLLTDNPEARYIEVEKTGEEVREEKGIFGKKKSVISKYMEVPSVFIKGSFNFEKATMDDGIEPNPNAILKVLIDQGYEFKLVSTREENAQFERALVRLKSSGLVSKVA